ncbi:hypothetical protein ACF0H5_001142 [Mactra antiquata]
MEDVNILAKHMNKLAKMDIGLSQALSQHEDHLSSYISSATHRMDNLMSGIKDNMLAIKLIQTDLYNNQAKLETVIQYLMDILIDQIKSTSTLNHQLEEFKLGILDLVHGRLSPLLIPEDILQGTLNDIQLLLHSKYTGAHLVVRTIADLYSSCQFLYTRNDIVTYCSLGSSAVLCVLLIWTIMRVRKLCVVVAVLQKSTSCKALPSSMPSFIYTPAPTANEKSPFLIDIDLTWEHANFIVLTLIVITFIVLLYKYLRHRHRATLCLEVAAGMDCILIDVMTLPLCPFNLDIKTPNQINDLAVQGSYCSSTLLVSWPDFTITNKLNNTIIHVINVIPVSMYAAAKLRRILKKAFIVQLYSKHHGTMIPLHNWVNPELDI